MATQSPRSRTLSGRPRDPLFLLLHQTLHRLVALRPRLLPRHFARRGVDRDSRLARSAHADSLRRGHALGRRLRRALLLPGRRLRQIRRPALDTEKIRHREVTRNRALPAGTLSVGFAWGFALVAAAALVVAAWRLNRLALELSPIVLAVLFFYSYTKRFTSWSHFVLGFCLGMSPAAAWIAIRGSLDARMLILCSAVTLWVGGFDVLYACQDVEFDKAAGLHSIPKKFGIASALLIARAMHVAVVALLAWLAWSFALAWPAWAGIIVVAALLAYEHSLVKPTDLSKLNAAFFAVNGYISVLFLIFWGAATLVMHP
ncbi:MAG TPA: UbiA-like polyprenyltransferase [Candidatus Acidoferrales bacterium]|nr:UbiA-like polyprenyltransferase [Candidatus Acidoferrales bacterium]